MKTLYDYRHEIHAAAAKISLANYLVVGIDSHGNLITDEAVDSNTRFNPGDVVEQGSVRGGSSFPWIEEHFLSRL